MTSFILLLNITLTIDKTQYLWFNLALYDSGKYCHGDKTLLWFAYELFMLLRKIWIFYGQEYRLICLK